MSPATHRRIDEGALALLLLLALACVGAQRWGEALAVSSLALVTRAGVGLAHMAVDRLTRRIP